MSMKNSSDTVGNQSRDLPAYSAVSHPNNLHGGLFKFPTIASVHVHYIPLLTINTWFCVSYVIQLKKHLWISQKFRNQLALKFPTIGPIGFIFSGYVYGVSVIRSVTGRYRVSGSRS